MQFFPDMRVERFDRADFALLLSSEDDAVIWGAFSSATDDLLVALAGRLAFDEADWAKGDALPGSGGAACRIVAARYREHGVEALRELNGNFTLILHDGKRNKLHLVTDRWGAYPAFAVEMGGRPLLYGSHPDILADAAGETGNIDLTSLAEFLITGRLSFPFTYYQRIKALGHGALVTAHFVSGGVPEIKSKRYVDYSFKGRENATEGELAEELAEAFRRSIRRRTNPRLGKTAVALSGGLDSRSVLSAAADRSSIIAFSAHDQVNYEFRIAEQIAKAAGVTLIPFQRPFDFYGDSSESGVGIAGGMGCIACNHFLGFRRQLRELGAKNLLTGCYCDYVFKGLVLNKTTRGLAKREEFAGYRHDTYEPHFWFDTAISKAVQERLDSQFPSELREYRTEEDRWLVEQRRLFPLCNEVDNAQRVIPQRVMGWYVPIADNDLFEAYLKIPCRMKLNRSIFVKAAKLLCDREISNIPDANTGAPVGASPASEFLHSNLLMLQRKWSRLRRSMVTNQSWPDWRIYGAQSKIVRRLWDRPNPEGWQIIRQIMGDRAFNNDIDRLLTENLMFFHHVFTLKLWLDLRQLR
jgi:asparagine synthase (glutamine-hydrolysing)